MRNWSMVRTGSTSTQKSLFFNLRRVRARIERETSGLDMDEASIRREIAEELGVPLRDVEMMEARMAGSDFLWSRVEKRIRGDRPARLDRRGTARAERVARALALIGVD